MNIGDRIKQRREHLNMSQEELARKVGYKSRSSINKIELDGRGLPQSKIVAFATALETTPAYIMGWTDTSSKNNKYEVYAEIKATSKNEAIYVAVKNMLLANGDTQKANSITEEEAVNLYNSSGFNEVQVVDERPHAIAAHFDGDEFTEDELDEIRQFAEFVKNKRK